MRDKPKVFIKSCHSTLEYDQALMFLRMGCAVAGNFDVGSVQRPKLEGVTDREHNFEDGVREADVFLLHQIENFHTAFEDICKARRHDQPVVINAFGQGCMDQHRYVTNVTKIFKNAYIVAYSITDYTRYRELGVEEDKIRMIRFGKAFEDYDQIPWTGKLPICYMACNSIIERGEGCGLWLSQALGETDLPLVITGRETSEMVPNGLGLLEPIAMFNLYRNARCYFVIGTQPAPYTLTLIEAMACGCPVIAYDNGCGIADEGFPVPLVKGVASALRGIGEVINNLPLAQAMGKSGYDYAREHFNSKHQAKKWMTFFEEMGI